jgi:hypothetical protein
VRRIRHHDDDGIGLLGNLPAGLADDATGRDKLRRNRPNVMQKQVMSGGLEMARHRTSHGAEADEADIDHAGVSLVAIRYRA